MLNALAQAEEDMLDGYRLQYQEFNSAFMREFYLFLSGQKSSLEIVPIYERYGELFTRDSIQKLTDELERTSSHFETTRKSISHLLMFAVEQFLENAAKQLTEQISECESSARIEFDGRSMTFHDGAIALAREADRRARRAIHNERSSIIRRSNDLRAERLARLREVAASLGEPSYRSLFERLRKIDYGVLASQANQIITGTEEAYTRSLSKALKERLNLSIDDAERHDAVFFVHLGEFDDRFPAANLIPIYKETMAGLGIDVDEQTRVLIDSEERPLKTSRAFCMPVSVPDEVKLVIRPSGGQSDYQSLLHESGHAQHYGWTSPSLLPEFKYTGDYALTETYAFLFNHLIGESEWLREFLQFQASEDFVRSALLARLVTIRRYAAKLSYEIRLHDGVDLDTAAELYAGSQTSATLFRTAPVDFLYDLDDGFYAASYLRAWANEVALREHLKTRFGRRWWTSRKAGGLLKELWETGDFYTADEIASQIGIGPIRFEPLIEEFNRALQ
jgi:oligoendopeptidase F